MANRTVKEAKNVHGTNPQYLIEKIIRSRIYDSKYWKEQCFALTAELLVDKAMELRFIGGVYGGNIKPTQFLCLTLKMLQIQPEKDIVVEFIKNEEFKYVRALGAFYLRLTGSALDCYKYLEPLYNDNRKLRQQNRNGQFEIVFMDDFIDELLRSDRVCDIILPRIQKRSVLEENNELEPKISALDEDLDDEVLSEEELEKEDIKKLKSRKREHSKSKSIENDRKREDTKKDFGNNPKKVFEKEKNKERQNREYNRYREKQKKYEKERDRKCCSSQTDRDVDHGIRSEKNSKSHKTFLEEDRKDRDRRWY